MLIKALISDERKTDAMDIDFRKICIKFRQIMHSNKKKEVFLVLCSSFLPSYRDKKEVNCINKEMVWVYFFLFQFCSLLCNIFFSTIRNFIKNKIKVKEI